MLGFIATPQNVKRIKRRYIASLFVGEKMAEISKSEKLAFYIVNPDYVEYLHSQDMAKNGFSCVPNMIYSVDRKEKFTCGILIPGENGIPYMVPVSSKKDEKSNSVVLYDKLLSNKEKRALGSVRLNYMFPVPKDECVKYEFYQNNDFKYISLLTAELKSANEQADTIRKLAKSTYIEVKNNVEKDKEVKWACNFSYLEVLYNKWEEKKTAKAAKENNVQQSESAAAPAQQQLSSPSSASKSGATSSKEQKVDIVPLRRFGVNQEGDALVKLEGKHGEKTPIWLAKGSFELDREGLHVIKVSASAQAKYNIPVPRQTMFQRKH